MAFLLTDKNHPVYHEFQLAVAHSMDLIHQILEGALLWGNRFKEIQKNKSLYRELLGSDVICLKECTDPNALLTWLNSEQGAKFSCVSHRVNESTKDHCAILFDRTQFKMIEAPYREALDKTKPYILIKLKHKKSGEEFVMGSVHHPGGGSNQLDVVLNKFTHPSSQIIRGDFNHPEGHFMKKTPHGFNMIFPRNTGTLCGNDYGHQGEAIDGLLTNLEGAKCHVETMSFSAHSPAKNGLFCLPRFKAIDQPRHGLRVAGFSPA